MKKTFTQNQNKKILKLTSIIVRYAKIGFYILAGALTISFLVILFIPGDNLQLDLANLQDINVQVFNMNMSFDQTSLDGVIAVKGLVLLGILLGEAYVVFAIYIFRKLQLIFKDVLIDQPFSSNNIRHLYNMGYAFIISSFVLPIFGAIFSNHLINLASLDNFNTNYMIDLKAFFMGLLIIVLATIFDYGHHLQDEYDMTV